MLGLEIIQLIYKRFGKDISIGESALFKTTHMQSAPTASPNSFLTALPEGKQLRKKATLFQEQFTPIDLNYKKIKREKIVEVTGPTLKRMEVTKKVNDLQREWQLAK